jgi:hypothetical protein
MTMGLSASTAPLILRRSSPKHVAVPDPTVLSFLTSQTLRIPSTIERLTWNLDDISLRVEGRTVYLGVFLFAIFTFLFLELV